MGNYLLDLSAEQVLVFAVAGLVGCVLNFAFRLRRMAAGGTILAGSGLLLAGAGLTLLLIPLGLNGTACGPASVAAAWGSSIPIGLGQCALVQRSVFDTATWLMVGALACAAVSFAPGYRARRPLAAAVALTEEPAEHVGRSA